MLFPGQPLSTNCHRTQHHSLSMPKSSPARSHVLGQSEHGQLIRTGLREVYRITPWQTEHRGAYLFVGKTVQHSNQETLLGERESEHRHESQTECLIWLEQVLVAAAQYVACTSWPASRGQPTTTEPLQRGKLTHAMMQQNVLPQLPCHSPWPLETAFY